MLLRLIEAGPWVSIQDSGRLGYQRYGIGPSGAMDPVSLALANRLVGNPPATAALEIRAPGITVVVEGGPVALAVAAPEARVALDGAPHADNATVRLTPGQRLRAGPGPGAAYAYLALAGGFALAEAFGSLSFHARSGIGGLGGRALAAGDALPLVPPPPAVPDLVALAPPVHPALGDGPIRVIEGPQADHLAAEARAALYGEAWAVQPRSDRMGVRLAGTRLQHSAKGAETISDGVVLGSIQVPGNGLPIVLGADRQTTGGYPKVAVVARADQPRFFQAPPGRTVRFAPITRDQAVAALAAHRRAVADMRVVPAGRLPDTAALMAENLIDGVYGGERD
ncbi:MAG: biotin-dependent carboxyltransferase family protein [Pseudomonadota bacterium]